MSIMDPAEVKAARASALKVKDSITGNDSGSKIEAHHLGEIKEIEEDRVFFS
jgi:hypothetical protein